MALPIFTEDTDNIESQPDQPVIGANALKQLFDLIGAQIKAYLNNTLLPFIEGTLGASNVGQSKAALGTTVQSAIDTLFLATGGSIPPDGTIDDDKLATDVKVGSLALSTTTDKSSVIAVINEINVNKVNTSNFRTFVSLSDLNKTDTTLTDVPNCSIPVVAGKTYKIETFAKYQTTITTTGIKFFSYMSSGAAVVSGQLTAYVDATLITTNFLIQTILAIGASGLTGSGLTTGGVIQINTDLLIYQNIILKCTSTGEFRHQFASEVAAASVLKAGVTVLVTEV